MLVAEVVALQQDQIHTTAVQTQVVQVVADQDPHKLDPQVHNILVVAVVVEEQVILVVREDPVLLSFLIQEVQEQQAVQLQLLPELQHTHSWLQEHLQLNRIKYANHF
jgi:hypothetical protein